MIIIITIMKSVQWCRGSVLELLHPAPDGHLHHLQAGPVYLLDQAEDGGQDVGVLQQKLA